MYTQDVPLTWDIFCFAVQIAVASIFADLNEPAKPTTKPCPCAAHVAFSSNEHVEVWDSQDTEEISFQKERRVKENPLLPTPL